MFRGRRERAIREQGRPATGVVRAARRSRGVWNVVVTVMPGDGAAFETRLRFTDLDGPEPLAGDLVDVLHSGGDAVPMDASVRFRTPPPAPAPDTQRPADDGPVPAAHEVIGQVLRRLADGSLLHGGPQIVIDDPPAPSGRVADAAQDATADVARPTIADLVARAEDDPSGVGDELLRRIVAGETTFTAVLDAARNAGPQGTAGARAVLTNLHARGLIGDGTLRMLMHMTA